MKEIRKENLAEVKWDLNQQPPGYKSSALRTIWAIQPYDGADPS